MGRETDMDDCLKCGGLGVICTKLPGSSCLDVSCKDCGKIEPCPVCKGKKVEVRDSKVLVLKT